MYLLYIQILQTHPDVNLANEHGNTPLHYAAFWNFIGICEVVMFFLITLHQHSDTFFFVEMLLHSQL